MGRPGFKESTLSVFGSPNPAGEQPAEKIPAPKADTDRDPTAGTDPTAEVEAMRAAGAELDAVEAALVRLDDGSFDTCQVCGAPIGRERLLQDPLLTRCGMHAGVTPSPG